MQHDTKKIALFVDFDNIYLGLRETSREAAEAFATRPGAWLKWIEHGMQLDPRADRGGPRENRVLIRRCYLNPDTFGKYRGYFTHSGFTVVDCPTLTSRGKNSSDIVMVMDILDALRHETHFDRFVIMSADADFTPVLQRLRAHDRRTAVLVSGQAAPAYRAACDRLITEDQFIELALEMPALPEPHRAAPGLPSPAAAASNGSASNGSGTSTANRDPELLAAIARRVYEEASSTGTLSASELPRILREFKEFTPSSNWLGYYSLQNLAEAVLAHRPELRITDDDPWRIAVQVAEEPAAPAPGEVPAQPAAAQQPGAEWDGIRERVMERVAGMVAESAEPVVMGKAAHVAIQEAGPLITETRWLGKGTFKNLLLSVPDLPFRVVASPLPGYLYDPARHADPRQRASTDGLAEMEPEMASLIRRIHQLTDAPKLTPRQYRVLWEVIAKEITRAPYSLMSTGKAVRDQCVERGEPIARQSITLVLRGLSYAAYRFWDPPHRADNLAYTYRGNLLNQLRQAQVTLSDDELRMLDDWLMGPIAEEPHEPSRPPVPASSATPPAGAAPAVTIPADAVPADAVSADAAPANSSPADATPADAAPAATIPADAVPADAVPADASPADATPADAAPAATIPADAVPADAVPADAVPADAAPNGAAPGDVGSPAQPEPVTSMDARSADALSVEPAETVEPDFATAGALPAAESHESASPDADTVAADWQPAAGAAPADAPPASEPVTTSVEDDVLPAVEDVSRVNDASHASQPTDRQAVDQPAGTQTADGQTVDQPTVDREVADRPSVDERPAGGATVDQRTVEGQAVDQPTGTQTADRQAVDQPTGTQTADGQTVDQPVDDLPSLVAEPPAAVEANPELADAIPAELSDDHGPRGPDEVTAEWEIAAEPAAAAPSDAGTPQASTAGPDASGPPGTPSAALPPSAETPSDAIVPAAWQPADAVSEPGQPAGSPSAVADAPAGPPPASNAASDEIVAAEWQPADAPPAAEAGPPAASPSTGAVSAAPAQPQTPASAAATDAASGTVYTPFWEAADEPASPAEPPPTASVPPAAGTDGSPGEPVMPLWEAVNPAAPADGSPPLADARSGRAPQMDAFPPEAPRDAPREDGHAQPPREGDSRR